MKAFLTALSIGGVAVAAQAAMAPADPRFLVKPALLPLPAEACAALTTKTVAPDGAPIKRLDQLPPGLIENAVLVSLNGCPVREIRDGGRHYYVGPSIPKTEPLAPPAHAK